MQKVPRRKFSGEISGACVKPNARRACHKGIVAEPLIERCVKDNQRFVFHDRVGAECLIARCLFGVEPVGRFEPLVILVDQRDQRDGDAEQPGGEPGQGIERFFFRGVQNSVRTERCDPFVVIGRNWNHGGRASVAGTPICYFMNF